MERDQLPHGSCDGAGRSLTRLRNRASGFFESLSIAELAHGANRHLWLSDWLRIANDYRWFAEAARINRSVQVTREAWLCALTAFEVARTLSCPGDSESVDLADKVDLSLKGWEDNAGSAVERVRIDCFGEGTLTGFFLPVFRYGPSAPVIVCVSDEGETVGSMMSRLLAASPRRSMSLLLVDAAHSSLRRTFKPEHLLQCWLDYLEARPDVDAQRIAIYGEGVGASQASRLALSDRRIAAAVCDGGLLTPVMRRESLRWMVGFDRAAHDGNSTGPLAPLRRVSCPLLIVVGSRSMVLEQDALDLQAGYRQAGADCSVVVPNRIPHPLGEVENFISVDDFIFEWLDSKLGAARQLGPVTYL